MYSYFCSLFFGCTQMLSGPRNTLSRKRDLTTWDRLGLSILWHKKDGISYTLTLAIQNFMTKWAFLSLGKSHGKNY